MKKLKVTDQIHVSSVQANSLRPGQEIVVTNAVAEELLKKHAGCFADLGDADEPAAEAEEKAEPSAPDNKAEPAAPANKARKGK